MGAATVTSTILSETEYEVRAVFTGAITDTQETTGLKIDASTFAGIDPTNGIVPKLSIKEVQYAVSSGQVNVLWDASSPVLALQLGGPNGYLNFKSTPLLNAGGSGVTGDIRFTTVGMANPSTYQVLLTLRKEHSAFTTAPIITAASFVDALSGVYATGDTMRLMLTFNQVVFADGASAKVGIVLDSGTVYATYQGHVTESAHDTGDGTKYMVFQYTVKSTDGVAAGNFTLGDITGVRGSSVGALPPVNVIPSASTSAFTVNLPGVLSTAGITNAHHYVSGDPINLTLTFNEPVIVTGTPQVPVVIHSTTRQASYVSGSGTTALLFRYTPVVSGDVATSGQFSITGTIGLNSGTIKANTVPATLTFTPPTTTTVIVN